MILKHHISGDNHAEDVGKWQGLVPPTNDLSYLLGSGTRTKGQITTTLHKKNKVSVTVVHIIAMSLRFS